MTGTSHVIGARDGLLVTLIYATPRKGQLARWLIALDFHGSPFVTLTETQYAQLASILAGYAGPGEPEAG